MIQEYTFFDGGTIEFEDTKSVKELIAAAFDAFGYYEPFGMEIVTIYQGGGKFTTDVNARCVDEIKDPRWLCFAYHMPNVFYFAEGGWGHHMPELINRPNIPNEVKLCIKFEDFDNTVIVNGNYCFNDIINVLKKVNYIPYYVDSIEVITLGDTHYNYTISVSDNLLDLCLTEFLKEIRDVQIVLKEPTANISTVKFLKSYIKNKSRWFPICFYNGNGGLVSSVLLTIASLVKTRIKRIEVLAI